ncbi:MAG: hypothetical protein N2484_04690 [Clostridia bacterium]|nr:hypothetical protein [Clostridia bacterium]
MSKFKVILILSVFTLIIASASAYIYYHMRFSHSNSADHAAQAVHQVASVHEGKKDPCQENQKLLQAKADQFKAVTGSYPPKLSLLVEMKYIPELPKCPGGNGYSIDQDGNVFEDSNYKETETQETVKTFTREELAQFDGKNGRKCYVALYGVVYDLTDVKGWKKGSHGHGIIGGKDWTALFEKHAPKSHKNPEFLKKLPVVGKYIGEPNPNTILQKAH